MIGERKAPKLDTEQLSIRSKFQHLKVYGGQLILHYEHKLTIFSGAMRKSSLDPRLLDRPTSEFEEIVL